MDDVPQHASQEISAGDIPDRGENAQSTLPKNSSGQGRNATVPAEVDRWNWGAFFFNWIWGIGNHTWIALLALIPFVNVVMAFVLGIRGSTWAWRNKKWDSVEHFKRTQRRWAIWGLIVYLVFSAAIIFIVNFLRMIQGVR